MAADPDSAQPLQQRNGLSPALRLKLGITYVLMQPGGKALAIVVNYVIGQSADWPVHAGSLTDQAAVELGITAIDQPDDPRPPIPPAVANPGALENQPETVNKRRAGGCAKLHCYLRGQLWGNPFVRIDEIDPGMPDFRKPERELPLPGEPEPWLHYYVCTQGTRDPDGAVR